MIRTENLTKIYKIDNVETYALQNVNIAIERGEFVALVGPSGSGKTTLFNILGLLDTPTSGSVKIDNKEVSILSDQQRTVYRKGNIAFVFQNFNLIEELTVYENIELPLIYMSLSKMERKKRINQSIERLQIGHRRNNFPKELQGGLKQKVAIARSIVMQPQLILADEPTGNLDSKSGAEVLDFLTELNNDGTTIILATHSSVDANKSNRIIQLFDGKILSENLKRAI